MKPWILFSTLLIAAPIHAFELSSQSIGQIKIQANNIISASGTTLTQKSNTQNIALIYHKY